jgi:hypothetical protein
VRHANGDAHIHADCDCDCDCHIHADGNCYAYTDSNGDSDIYCNGYGNCDSDGYGDSNCDRIAAAYTDATASSDAAAPTVRPAGCSLAWELASEPREFPLWPQSICFARATVPRNVPRFPCSDWTSLRFRRRSTVQRVAV